MAFLTFAEAKVNTKKKEKEKEKEKEKKEKKEKRTNLTPPPASGRGLNIFQKRSKSHTFSIRKVLPFHFISIFSECIIMTYYIPSVVVAVQAY